MRILKWLLPLLVIALLAFILWGYPSLITGDNVQFSVDKIDTEPNGHASATLTVVTYPDIKLVTTYYDGDKFGGSSSTGGLKGFLGRPTTTHEIASLNLYPEGNGAQPPDTSWNSRILLHAGDQKSLKVGDKVYLYDFKTADGVRHYGYLEAQHGSQDAAN